jgi:acetyl-CoA synthetase
MSTLESILKETRSFPPSDDFRHKATVSGHGGLQRAVRTG